MTTGQVSDINDLRRRNGAMPHGLQSGVHPVSPSAQSDWHEPVPLKAPSPTIERPFPTDCLPTFMATFVRQLSEQMQVPEAMAAASALAATSAAVQRSWVVRAIQDWREPLSTFWCICAEPADRKSPVYSRSSKPLNTWEEAESKRTAAARAKNSTKRKILESQLASALKRAAKTGTDFDHQEAAQAKEDLDNFVTMVEPRVYVQDVTPEKLAHVMAEQRGRLAILDSEAGLFETMAGRYSDGVPNIDIFLKGHAGEPVRIDRKNGTAVRIEKANLTIGLMVQPDVIRELATKPGFRGRGLLARFQYVIPKSHMGQRVSRSATMDSGVYDAYERMLHSALNWAERKRDEVTGEWEATELEMSEDARDAYYDFADRIEPELGPGGSLNQIQDWAGKWGGVVVRVAGLLALSEHFDSYPVYPQSAPTTEPDFLDGVEFEEPPAQPIPTVELRHFNAALQIGEYLKDSALVAFGAVMGQSEQAMGDRVIAWLKRKSLREVTKRDILMGLRVKLAQLDPALEALEQHGYLKKSDPKQRNSTQWSVNPALWMPPPKAQRKAK
jgi:hypothetical protein